MGKQYDYIEVPQISREHRVDSDGDLELFSKHISGVEDAEEIIKALQEYIDWCKSEG